VPSLAHERHWWEQGAIVCGVDEVGRGAWAGPVAYGAVILPRTRRLYKLRDSKVLEPGWRRELAGRVRRTALAVSVGQASNDEIDRLGMSAAMRLGARRAVEGLPLRPDVCLLDGNWDFLSDLPTTNETIVGGDGRSASIAAASIVAKVARDDQMVDACPAYPAYRFSSNKGYPTPDHLAALARWGPCGLHRRSWRPIGAAGPPSPILAWAEEH
jgi:ribonuclease HII